ncbi:IS110 family transposase [Jiangella mangrovi]|uniref:Transposase n=1 Tax=Jiangella mangrovi TaxID=1524084 RepID=A0A7W9GV22_9ACTN|nr:IS110 family transposase [Jiangella mangrovi]MBB5787926.1 transposase [Jiangella mangrovi]MBB5789626.1 transposase [Jiangella mangrovi]MBB5790191.1 transposase [Jiangella mangrovi]
MVTVGIDPHKQTHTAVIIDEAGRRVGTPLTVDDDPSSVAKLLAWAGRRAAGRAVTWAIEDGRALARRLASALVAAGQVVVWVPVRLMVAERHHTGPRGKSDPLDALAVAKAALNPDNARYLATHRVDDPGAQLAPLVEHRDQLVGERTRLINTMRWRLHQLAPGLEPTTLTTLKAPRELAARLEEFPDTPLRRVLLANCHRLETLTSDINELTRELGEHTRRVCPNLLAIPGVGPVVAATILAELGDPTRIRNGAALARLAGTAPIPVWSSDTERHRLDRGGNRRLNRALHTIARTQARSHRPAQALIAKHQDTKGKRGAIRVLKRHLTNVIHRALRHDIPPTTCQPSAA